MFRTELIEAVHGGRAGSFASGPPSDVAGDDPALRARIVTACSAIHTAVGVERERVLARLLAEGIEATSPAPTALPQRHTFRLDVADHETAERVAAALADDGYERWDAWTRGAARSFARHADHLTVARTADVTTVIRVAWQHRAPRSRLERILGPTEGDWQMVTLPGAAWWAYPLVRVVRLAAERLGLRRRHEATLGPFLATPVSLLQPLLDTVETTAADVVLDLGCGDGRLPVTAAQAGSRAIGVERSPELAARARDRAAAAGVGDRVEIIIGDARDTPLDRADVVFAFLPTDVFADLLPTLLGRMRPGARLLAHEQNRLPGTLRPSPDRSAVVAAADALTVAHVWSAGERRR